MAVIRIDLVVDDEDVDPDAPTGLTVEAFGRLYSLLTEAGFEFTASPADPDDTDVLDDC